MIRLILSSPFRDRQVLEFTDDTVTIGRAPNNHIRLDDRGVSKLHGCVMVTADGYLYRDLNSTNGSLVVHEGKTVALTARECTEHSLVSGDVIQIATYSLGLEEREPGVPGERRDMTIVLNRPDSPDEA